MTVEAKIQGRVQMHAPMQEFIKVRTPFANSKTPDGWIVMYSYRCPCGAAHSDNAFNVWSDHKTDTVEHYCPTRDATNLVELERPA